MANINDFKAKLAGGGARSNQFKVTMPFPGYAQVGGEIEDLAFLCRSTKIPAMNVGVVEVPFRGRNLYVAGEREFAEWTTMVFNDTDFAIRREMERWMNGINDTVNNTGATNPADYRVDMIIQQLDRDDTVLHQYTLEGCFPRAIGAIELAYDTNDAIEEFEITWRYDTFRVSGINL